MQSSDIKHILVTDENILGPLMTSEVLDFFKNDPNKLHTVQWISPENLPPVLLQEWFSDYAPEGTYDQILAMSVGGLSHTNGAWNHKGKHAESAPRRDTQFGKTHNESGLSSLRDWIALLCLAIFGAGLLWVGVKTLRPARMLVKNDKPLAAKLLSATPDALKNYQNLLEGKIKRDGQKYARALVAIQKDKELYPNGFLPSPEITAAIALVHLSHEELDKQAEWKALLNRMTPEARQSGLAVVAYELSRVFVIRKNLLPLLNKQNKRMANSKVIQQSAEELDVILERMVRVIPNSEPNERVLHGVFLSRLLSLTLVTALEFPQVAQIQPQFKKSLEKVKDLYPFLSTADQGIISELVELVKAKISQPKAKVDWAKSLERLVELNTAQKFLCQLNETGSGADALLYILTQASAEHQKLPGIENIFESCFVGLRVYPRTSEFSLQQEGSGVTPYSTIGTLDEGLLRNFRAKYPTFNPILNRLKGQRNVGGDWMLVLYQNGVLKGRLTGVKSKSVTTLCGARQADTLLCSQVLWSEFSDRWRDRISLIIDLREDIKPTELNLLGHNFIFQAAQEVLNSNRKNKSKEIFEALNAVKEFVDREDPQIQFLMDYIESIGLET